MALLRYFEPDDIEEVGDDGKWLIYATNNPSVYNIADRLFPQCYALSYRRSVHPVDACDFITMFKDDELSELNGTLPFGVNALQSSSLVCVRNLPTPVRFVENYTAQIGSLFEKWSRNWISVLLPVAYSVEWKDRDTEKLMEVIQFHYGNTVRNLISSRSELIVHHDPDVRVLPKRVNK